MIGSVSFFIIKFYYDFLGLSISRRCRESDTLRIQVLYVHVELCSESYACGVLLIWFHHCVALGGFWARIFYLLYRSFLPFSRHSRLPFQKHSNSFLNLDKAQGAFWLFLTGVFIAGTERLDNQQSADLISHAHIFIIAGIMWIVELSSHSCVDK